MSAQLAAPSGASANTALPVRRNLSQAITSRLMRADGKELCALLGKDESVISRLRSGERGVNLFEFLKVLTFLGYKVVSANKICVDPDELNMLRRHYMHTHGGLQDWGDEE